MEDDIFSAQRTQVGRIVFCFSINCHTLIDLTGSHDPAVAITRMINVFGTTTKPEILAGTKWRKHRVDF